VKFSGRGIQLQVRFVERDGPAFVFGRQVLVNLGIRKLVMKPMAMNILATSVRHVLDGS
jgi:hypothetical protein